MAETLCPECGAETSGGDACPACGGALEAKPVDDRPLNVIDAKEIVVKVLWGTGALMLCGGRGRALFRRDEAGRRPSGLGGCSVRRFLRARLVDVRVRFSAWRPRQDSNLRPTD